jgi:hypothetical protein
VSNLQDYYVARLASIYRNQPKASATVALFVKQLQADGLALLLNPAYDLSQAQGAQLDVIGKYVGVSRDVQVPDTRPYFGFSTESYPAGDQNPNGFTLVNSIATNAQGIWYRIQFANQSTSQLSDFSYRQLIQLKIMTNASDCTMAAIQDLIAVLFPGQLRLRDNLDMSATYFYGAGFQLPLSVLVNSFPRPMGVEIAAQTDVGFDVLVDGAPAFNSQIQNPIVQFTEVTETFTITNVQELPFTVTEVEMDDIGFVASGFSPALPVTLNIGDSLTFDVTYTIIPA